MAKNWMMAECGGKFVQVLPQDIETEKSAICENEECGLRRWYVRKGDNTPVPAVHVKDGVVDGCLALGIGQIVVRMTRV